jgi:2-methylisocitrate lyase-like PEP mutase family enzyme
MARVCREVPGPQMANLVEDGDTPLLPPSRLEALGYKIAAHPLTLLLVAARAMRRALAEMKSGSHPTERLRFEALQELVGFPEYDAALARLHSE